MVLMDNSPNSVHITPASRYPLNETGTPPGQSNAKSALMNYAGATTRTCRENRLSCLIRGRISPKSVYPTIYDLRLVGYIVITHLTQPEVNMGYYRELSWSTRTDGSLSVQLYTYVRDSYPSLSNYSA